MTKETAISITAMICLTIIFIVASYQMPQANELFYGIVAAIAGLAGYYIPKAVVAGIKNIRERTKK